MNTILNGGFLMKCDSCGEEFSNPAHFAKYDEEKKFCIYCADSDGNLRPLNEVRESIIEYWMKRDKMDHAAAESLIDTHLEKQPAWSKK